MVTQLKAQIESQKVELEAAAAASLEKAEEAFTKQLAEMQTLLSDYQTQVWGVAGWFSGVGCTGFLGRGPSASSWLRRRRCFCQASTSTGGNHQSCAPHLGNTYSNTYSLPPPLALGTLGTHSPPHTRASRRPL